MLPEPETAGAESEGFAAHPEDAPEDGEGEEEAEGAEPHTEDTEDASETVPLSDLLLRDLTTHWTPTARSYFSRVTKGQILAAVREAVGDDAASRLHRLKKPEMSEAAEQLVQATGWLPACLRTPAPPEETAQEPLALPLSEPTPDLPEAAE